MGRAAGRMWRRSRSTPGPYRAELAHAPRPGLSSVESTWRCLRFLSEVKQCVPCGVELEPHMLGQGVRHMFRNILVAMMCCVMGFVASAAAPSTKGAAPKPGALTNQAPDQELEEILVEGRKPIKDK